GGIGPGQADAPVGELGVGGPDLLAGDPPAPVDPCGRGAQAGEVAAGVGLAEQLAEQGAGVEDPRQPAPLLLVGAVGQEGRTGQVEADAADLLGGPGPGP